MDPRSACASTSRRCGPSAGVAFSFSRSPQPYPPLPRIFGDVTTSRVPYLEKEEELSCPVGSRWRVLILGLGSGELHQFLLNHFSCLREVVSVEVSAEVLHVSERFMGLGRFGGTSGDRPNLSDEGKVGDGEVGEVDGEGVCAVYRLAPNGTNGDLAMKEVRAPLPRCRSIVVLSDAWDFIHYTAEESTAIPEDAGGDPAHTCARPFPGHGHSNGNCNGEERDMLYDFIMFDVFTMLSASWDGEEGKGESNPFVDRASSLLTLHAVRKLLRPGAGIVVFHIHRDGLYEEYTSRIVEVFGLSQTVILVVMTNDNLVVASRETYREKGEVEGLAHPCESAIAFADFVEQFSDLSQYTRRIGLEGRYALDCSLYHNS